MSVNVHVILWHGLDIAYLRVSVCVSVCLSFCLCKLSGICSAIDRCPSSSSSHYYFITVRYRRDSIRLHGCLYGDRVLQPSLPPSVVSDVDQGRVGVNGPSERRAFPDQIIRLLCIDDRLLVTHQSPPLGETGEGRLELRQPATHLSQHPYLRSSIHLFIRQFLFLFTFSFLLTSLSTSYRCLSAFPSVPIRLSSVHLSIHMSLHCPCVHAFLLSFRSVTDFFPRSFLRSSLHVSVIPFLVASFDRSLLCPPLWLTLVRPSFPVPVSVFPSVHPVIDLPLLPFLRPSFLPRLTLSASVSVCLSLAVFLSVCLSVCVSLSAF